MIEDSDPASGMSPDELLAELEARLQELEAAGGELPSVVKRQLERIKRIMAEGRAKGIQFMQAGDQNSGFMGFSAPVESGSSEDDPEKGAT